MCTRLKRSSNTSGSATLSLEHDKVELARIYSFLGKVESRLGNPEQAKKHFSSSLDILRKLNLELDTDAAYTYRHLFAVQCDLGEHQEAEKNFNNNIMYLTDAFTKLNAHYNKR